jgi:hypothetical protein
MARNRHAERGNGARGARTARRWARSLMALATLIRLRGATGDRPRRIDLIIDYFGESRRVGQHG